MGSGTRCSYKCLRVSVVDPSVFATKGFRFNKTYKIRILVAMPSDKVTNVSELSFVVFSFTQACLGSREKDIMAKHRFA